MTAAAIKDLARTLVSSYADNTVKILTDESTAWFKLDDIEFSIRKIDASFPNYKRILNNEIYTILKVQTANLISVLERVDIIAKTNPAHIMAMTLIPDTNEVKVTARSPEHGTVNEVLFATVEQNYLQAGFNVSFFMDGLKTIGAGEARIEFSSEEGQARMYRGDSDDFLYMLMPARLSAQDVLTEEEIGDFRTPVEEPEPLPEPEPGTRSSSWFSCVGSSSFLLVAPRFHAGGG